MSKQVLRLKEDVQLQSSNRIATDAVEFEKFTYKFKKGTLFINEGMPKHNPDEDEDCVENSGMHGWCYIEEYSKAGSPFVKYCNFHAYILDQWSNYPELFEKVEDESKS